MRLPFRFTTWVVTSLGWLWDRGLVARTWVIFTSCSLVFIASPILFLKMVQALYHLINLGQSLILSLWPVLSLSNELETVTFLTSLRDLLGGSRPMLLDQHGDFSIGSLSENSSTSQTYKSLNKDRISPDSLTKVRLYWVGGSLCCSARNENFELLSDLYFLEKVEHFISPCPGWWLFELVLNPSCPLDWRIQISRAKSYIHLCSLTISKVIMPYPLRTRSSPRILFLELETTHKITNARDLLFFKITNHVFSLILNKLKPREHFAYQIIDLFITFHHFCKLNRQSLFLS